MNRISRVVLGAAIVSALVSVVAVCWHSLGEIHYLKTFYPERFSVAEVFYASAVELVKVVIIALPLALIIGVCLSLLRHFNKKY